MNGARESGDDLRGTDHRGVARLIIVDDHRLVRDSLAMALDREPGLQVVGTGASVAEAHELVERHRPDVVLLDQLLPDGRGTDVADALRVRSPRVRALVFTSSEDAGSAADAIRAGCAGFLDKTAGYATLLRTVRIVLDGDSVFDVRPLTGPRTG